MIQFLKMEEFHLGYQFFMNRPSNAVKNFIFITAGMLLAAFVWAITAKMDNVIKATAFLRPAETISVIKPLAGGQVQKKNYAHNEYVNEGDLLLRLDVTADVLELKNSNELMARIENGITVHNTLLETIRREANAASRGSGDAYLHSERYLLENRRQAMQIEELRKKLEIEKSRPEMLAVRERTDEMERELERAALQLDLWKNETLIEASETIKNLTQSRENLERRMSDLERNIKNATIYAPISGRVNELRKLNAGDNIVPGEEIITVVPEDESKLKAELYIEPAYIAMVRPGQKAVLQFPGLPPSKYGKIEAEINLIPADYTVFQDTGPVFVAEAEIREPWLVSRGGERIRLRSGIGASGRIVLDRDTVLRMILKKLDFISENYEQKRVKEK